MNLTLIIGVVSLGLWIAYTMFKLRSDKRVPLKPIPYPVTIGEMFLSRVKQSGQNPAWWQRHETGREWKETTYGEWYTQSKAIAQAMLKLGIKKGDKVAILGATRGEVYSGYGDLFNRSVGIYQKQSSESLQYVIEHSESSIIFVEGQKNLKQVSEVTKNNPNIKAIVSWYELDAKDVTDKRVIGWGAFCTHNSELSDDEIQEMVKQQRSDDIVVFIYTSGTTGPPKAVMLSHANLISLLYSLEELLPPVYATDFFYVFLPMAHAAERFGYCSRIAYGAPTYFATNMGVIMDELNEVTPTIFGAVPRIFEKAYAKVQTEAAKKSAVTKSIFSWALRVRREKVRIELTGQPPKQAPVLLRLQCAIADALVFKKIRKQFLGGNLRYFLTGAAPISVNILEFFWACNLPIYEVYGMSESTVATHMNLPGCVKLGTVGKTVPCAQHRIAEDGEILIKGAIVFQGYYKDAKATAETIIDGWLHTGLFPSLFLHTPFVRRPFVSAMITPSPMDTLEFGMERKLIATDEYKDPTARSERLNNAMENIVKDTEFLLRITKAVQRGNKSLMHVEQIKKFYVLPRDFSQEQSEMTPTMKVKRREVEKKFQAIFDQIYDNSLGVNV